MINYDKVCEEILKVDSKMRYAGIYHKGAFYSKMPNGLKSLLNEAEIKNSALNAVKRWETRLSLASQLGNPIYSLTKYEKVNRITFPVGEDGLILVSTEPSLDSKLIIDKILDIKKKYLSE